MTPSIGGSPQPAGAPHMSRMSRFLGGVSLGYVHLLLVTVVGLWMTPFLLGRVGSHTLGVWLMLQQVLGYLLLTDFGVSALLPREAAFATGRAGGVGQASDLPLVVARARQVVMWQMPVVAAAGFAAWMLVPARYSDAAGALAVIIIAFTILFPCRLYQAFLQGVQELPFLSKLQIAAWTVNTGIVISLVLAGRGLQALTLGWVAGQSITAALSWWQVRRLYAGSWPGWHVRPHFQETRSYLTRASWVGVAQLAQVFLTGSDMLLIGSVLGASAVVEYSCTGKLTTVLSSYPQIIMVAATPALCEMWASKRRDALVDTTTALMLLMLTISGLIACVVLAANQSFVTWWVGAEHFGGPRLTFLFALMLIARHWNITLIYGLLAFGQDRRVSVINLADGAMSVAAGGALVFLMGSEGAVLGSLLSVAAVSLPGNLVVLAREAGSTPRAVCAMLWPWAWRLLVLVVCCASVPLLWAPSTLGGIAALAAAVSLTYAVVMAHGLRNGPLGAFVLPRIALMLPATVRWLRVSSVEP